MIVNFAIDTFVSLGLWAWLSFLNKRKKGRYLVPSGGEDVYVRDEALLDLTDREQVRFRYSK